MQNWVNEIHHGDAFDVIDELPDASVHAVVTDPPYGLAFMGRDWDDFEPREYQEWCENWARRAKRVLKPGGHLLAFSGNRTHHRLFTGVEDAGFEVRDTLTWHYGSGFPKATDVSKTIDKRADADREVVGTREADDVTSGNYGQGDSIGEGRQGERTTYEYTKAATDGAKRWEGWKTGLKPATEFVVMARKPFDGATVDCVLEHGTGALNVGGCRIGTEERENTVDDKRDGLVGGNYNDPVREEVVEGRYPANVAFDERAAESLDAEVGELDVGARPQKRDGLGSDRTLPSTSEGQEFNERRETDSGGPSRYFYTSKATRAERTLGGQIDNAHPTVKPLDLMEWLVKLVTREDQIVLDPFAGTGTTCKAAKNLNREFIGVEKQAKYVAVAQARAGVTVDEPEYIDDENTTLRAYADGGGDDD